MSKTNPSPGLITWTFDAAPVQEATPEKDAAAVSGPTPFQFAQVLFRTLRPFPGAYAAMLTALRQFWPLPDLAAPSG